MIPLMMLPRVLRDRRRALPPDRGAVFALGLSAECLAVSSLSGAAYRALYVVLLQAMRHLRVWRPGGQPSGLFLVRAIPVICLALVAVRLFAEPLHIDIGRWPATSMWYGPAPSGPERARMLAKFESYPGRQLAIVRYAADHAPFDDWVYNAADIDKSKVVWAREMDAQSNADLFQYFADRTVWLVEPDGDSPKLSAYLPLVRQPTLGICPTPQSASNLLQEKSRQLRLAFDQHAASVR